MNINNYLLILLAEGGIEPPLHGYEPDERPYSTLPAIDLDRTRTHNPLCVKQMLYHELPRHLICVPATPSDTPTLLRLNTHYSR